MTLIESLDALGIRCVIQPMSYLSRFHLINTLDDVGVVLVCRPLRYLHRFAAFLLDSDLYPAISSQLSLSDWASLKADESLVTSITSTLTSRNGGRSGGSSAATRRVSERGRIRKTGKSRGGKSKGASRRSTRSTGSTKTTKTTTSGMGSEVEGSMSTSVWSAGRKELMRINGRP
jgi:hypothetical protein